MRLIYKILPSAAWQAAVASGVFHGSAVDLADGFIHFSDASQVRETAAKYFYGQDGLALVALDADRFGNAMKWEPSRGGALFPHLYAELDPRLVLRCVPLPWNGSCHVFPDDMSGSGT